MTNPKELIEFHRRKTELDKSLGMNIPVHLPLATVDGIVVSQLIARRKHPLTGEPTECQEAIDKILKTYYLIPEEFEKYVIKGKKLKFKA